MQKYNNFGQYGHDETLLIRDGSGLGQLLLLHDLLDPLHYLRVELQVDCHGLALNDLLNATLPCEPLVAAWVGLYHLDQLVRCDEVVQNHHVLR